MIGFALIIFTLTPLIWGKDGGRSPSQTYSSCQRKTQDPLEGCPENTIYVSQTDTNAQFTAVQSAILSIPNNTVPYFVLIAPGNYTEQLNVTRRGPITLLGVSDSPYNSQSYSNIDYNTTKSNEVNIWWNSANHDAIFTDNTFTSVLTVAPNFNASLTGSGPTGFPVPADTPFGCTDFRAYNIDFRNEYAPRSSGPAHAVGVSRANAGFYSCGFYSYQDTVYIGKLGNAYFYDSIIAGQTDFLYGFGTAYFEKSSLSLRNCGGGITAWKGTNTTFANKYGVYISDSSVLATNSSIALTIKGKCPLGRPWNSQQRSIFMNSYFDASILPQGYINWDTRYNNYTFMAVYEDYGPGWNVTEMRNSNFTTVLNDSQVHPYRLPKDVFQTTSGEFGKIGWIDHSVLPARSLS